MTYFTLMLHFLSIGLEEAVSCKAEFINGATYQMEKKPISYLLESRYEGLNLLLSRSSNRKLILALDSKIVVGWLLKNTRIHWKAKFSYLMFGNFLLLMIGMLHKSEGNKTSQLTG